MTVDLDRLEAARAKWDRPDITIAGRFIAMQDYHGELRFAAPGLITELREARTRLAALEQPVVTWEMVNAARNVTIDDCMSLDYILRRGLYAEGAQQPKEDAIYLMRAALTAALQVRASSAKTADDSASGEDRAKPKTGSWMQACTWCSADFGQLADRLIDAGWTATPPSPGGQRVEAPASPTVPASQDVEIQQRVTGPLWVWQLERTYREQQILGDPRVRVTVPTAPPSVEAPALDEAALVEKMARAMCEADGHDPDRHDGGGLRWMVFKNMAVAALACVRRELHLEPDA